MPLVSRAANPRRTRRASCGGPRGAGCHVHVLVLGDRARLPAQQGEPRRTPLGRLCCRPRPGAALRSSAATPATATTTATAASASTRLVLALGDDARLPGRVVGGVGRLVVEVVEAEDLGLGEILLGQRPGGARQALARQGDEARPVGPRTRGDRLGRARPGAAPRATGRGNGFGVTTTPAATATAATGAGALGLLVRHFGHRQVRVVAVGDAPSGSGALLDARQLDDVGELVGDLDEVRAGVAAEADDLDADALLLDRPDGRREVAVARHDDGDVQVPGRLHHVDDELDVEVRLDLAVAVLADVLADDLVVAAAQEVVEVALVLVVRVEPGVCVGAHEVAPGGCRLQQGDVVDVHARGLGRIEDVRHVHEDGDVLAHWYSLVSSAVSGRRAHAARRGRSYRSTRGGSRRGHGS